MSDSHFYACPNFADLSQRDSNSHMIFPKNLWVIVISGFPWHGPISFAPNVPFNSSYLTILKMLSLLRKLTPYLLPSLQYFGQLKWAISSLFLKCLFKRGEVNFRENFVDDEEIAMKMKCTLCHQRIPLSNHNLGISLTRSIVDSLTSTHKKSFHLFRETKEIFDWLVNSVLRPIYSRHCTDFFETMLITCTYIIFLSLASYVKGPFV